MFVDIDLTLMYYIYRNTSVQYNTYIYIYENMYTYLISISIYSDNFIYNRIYVVYVYIYVCLCILFPNLKRKGFAFTCFLRYGRWILEARR